MKNCAAFSYSYGLEILMATYNEDLHTFILTSDVTFQTFIVEKKYQLHL